VLLAALLSAGQPARAADPRTESAREHSAQGDAYYKLEKYSNAIGEYEQAYLAKADPSFLYNIAQCHRLMGQGVEAIKFYRRFLKDAPNATNRAIAEKHIKDLEDASARPGSPAEPSSTTPPPLPAAAATPATTAPPAPLSAPPSIGAGPPTTATPPSMAPPPLALNPPQPTSTPSSEASLQLSSTSTENGLPPPQQTHSFYTRWWFWTAVGVVVVGGIVIAAAATRDPACPGGYRCN
jgi:tetratricopeptide (TPR) repeat protein